MESDRQEPSYQMPDSLPAPLPAAAPNPLPMIGLGLPASVILGGALFAIGQFFYVYILFNVFLGIGIGMAAGFGVRKGHFTNGSALLASAIAFSVVAYGTFNYALYQSVLAEYPGVDFGFGAFLKIRAENDTVFGDFCPGTVGNIIVWIIEAAITAFYAARGILGAAEKVEIEAVPHPVIEFVLNLAVQGRETGEIEQELNRRGWSRPEDRERAMKAATTVMMAMQEAQKESNT